jgi:putative glutamine amidotransferase
VTEPTLHRARIGLTTYRETAAWGVWHESADLLPATYADAISAAGGAPMLLPPSAAEPGIDVQANVVLDGVHGVVLTGGPDVDPARYGAEAHPQTGPARVGRDSWELALTRAALVRRLPVLAICRGMELLNVALGGTLVQHLPDVVGSTMHCAVVGQHAPHDVRLEPASRLGSVLGPAVSAASYHHQGVDVLGDGLVATGWASDGVVEAVELDGDGWVVGVQWHPEVADGAQLFLEFVAQCSRSASGGVALRLVESAGARD